MRICSACNYELDAFDERCPRCVRARTRPAAAAAPNVAAQTRANVGAVTKTSRAKTPVVRKVAVSQLGVAGALGAAATFIIPAILFAIFSLEASDRSGKMPTADIPVFLFALLLSVLGGFMATANAKFWWGMASGVASALVWMLLCNVFASFDGSLLAMSMGLCLYEGGAIYGAIRRVENNLPPVNGALVLSIVTFLFCLFFAIPGIAVTVLLTNADSDYSRPALIGTVLGLGFWALALVARMAAPPYPMM